MATRYAGKTNAPDFPAGAEWLNTPKPLSIRDFAGKLLILDFWTYCCINCMHIVPVLRRLERDYPEELSVVGVHSAKFDEERATENNRQARFYELTRAGRRQLAEERENWERLSGAVARILEAT